jgi:hypothetical protein
MELPGEFLVYMAGRKNYTDRFVYLKAAPVNSETWRIWWGEPSQDYVIVPTKVEPFSSFVSVSESGLASESGLVSVWISDASSAPVTVRASIHGGMRQDGAVLPILEIRPTWVIGKPAGQRTLPRNLQVVVLSGNPIFVPKMPREAVSPHVASIIVAHARAAGDICPITAEAFHDGDIAVLPCGHLFSAYALSHCEYNICPSCRQLGRPTLL